MQSEAVAQSFISHGWTRMDTDFHGFSRMAMDAAEKHPSLSVKSVVLILVRVRKTKQLQVSNAERHFANLCVSAALRQVQND
jgi:hypothetical protein